MGILHQTVTLRAVIQRIAVPVTLLLTALQGNAETSGSRNDDGISDLARAGYSVGALLTPEQAEHMLSTLPLGREEGIWYSPADEMTLMILRDHAAPDSFGIFILASDDCRLQPGMRIGTLTPSADVSLYRLALMTRYDSKKGLHLPLDGTAKASSDFTRFVIEAPRLKLSLTPSVIIPNLLSMLRLRLNVRYSDPTSKLHDGWLRLYPSPAASTRPIYL